jgi:hypothetical protein
VIGRLDLGDSAIAIPDFGSDRKLSLAYLANDIVIVSGLDPFGRADVARAIELVVPV